MYEELYIIDNGKRLKVDLSIPSGITLNFKSNIFGDLSKITCSYTYTFKLPLTANNRRVFENADDIRCISNKIRRRLKAEYIQNGIPLFSNANLYIDSTESCFNAVMTWGVIDGLQVLKDDDISLQELDYAKSIIFGRTDAKISDYQNDVDCVKPIYNAGAPYIDDWGNKGVGMGVHKGKDIRLYCAFPPPAVPIYRLVELINSQFGTTFKFGDPYKYGEESSNHELIKFGVVPLVKIEQSDEMNAKNSYEAPFEVSTSTWCGKRNLLKIKNGSPSPTKSLYSFNSGIGIRINSTTARSFELDGKVFGIFKFKNDYSAPVDGQMSYYHYVTGAGDYKPCLKVYATTNGTSCTEIASLEGKYLIPYGWLFDFTKDDGYDRIAIDVPAGATVFFGFHAGDECEGKEFQVVKLTDPKEPDNNEYLWSNVIKSIEFLPTIGEAGIDVFAGNEDSAGSLEIDLVSNLPDISVMTFVKSIYFMMGAFPAIDMKGDIVPIFYSDLRESVLDGRAVDWSNKMTTDDSALPQKTQYAVSGFGQSNWYLMKSDNLDGDNEDEKDEYETGKGKISVCNEVIEATKTIIQLPFNAPYKKNKLAPNHVVGSTLKLWDISVKDNKIDIAEAKPIVGMVRPFVQTSDGNTETGVVWMGMEAWNGFAAINSDPSYAYLSKIMENPIVITEKLRLNEHDLRTLDYTVPVYLAKYGAYFAIVSISRDSKGISKCELLKLPEE